MKPDCKQIRERLADLAEGAEIPGADEHLAACATCRKELSTLQQMISGLKLASFEPSPEVLAKAIDLMPKFPIRTARLVLGQMGLVRSSGAEEFQLVFEEEGVHARLMYQPIPSGWLVTGRLDGNIESLEGPAGEIPLEAAGRFRFEVEELDDTDLYVQSQTGIIKIPAATEGSVDGSERSS